MTEQDARTILNLDPDYSAEQVREAYRDLVKVWHPDRFANDQRLREKAARRLQDINEAYALLQGDSAPRPSTAETDDGAVPFDVDSTPGSDPAPAQDSTALIRLIATGAALGFGVVAITTLVFWPQLRKPAPDDSAGITLADRAAPEQPQATEAPARASGTSSPGVSRPQSGSELVMPERQGGGSLVVYNQSQHDGVVSLVTSGGSERAVYVRSGEQATLANVATGRYQVRMALGLDWAANRFTRDATYQELEEPVDFVERAGDGDTEFTRLTLSLQPIVAGMQGVRAVPPFALRP